MNRLRSSENFIPELSLVAEIDNKIVGHILFTKAKVGDIVVLSLASLSALPEYQHIGIGTKLMEEGHLFCRISFCRFWNLLSN